MRIKTSELQRDALDWAVAKAEGQTSFYFDGYDYNPQTLQIYTAGGCSRRFNYSSNWLQGGPIIEREKISLESFPMDWEATSSNFKVKQTGPTPLIAAMRCYVASKLGDEVEIPEELA
jgi:hypothetical protein